ncbi:hypothetical protein KC19_VG311300 [Ceratodon purpureus]|uniref:Uncharacterized protein n=1 Tax=Ceratodon purpureus TaxID=3225 RepID=A0A8T0HW55_CERPU|nr:hypothetical protein KC19_VG311300 [Ceratodon purpureus]
MSLFPIPKASNSRQQNAYTASNDFNAALPNSELHCLGCINSMSPQHQQSELRTTTGSFAKHRGTFRLQGQLINSNVHSTTFKHDPHFPSNHFLLNSHSTYTHTDMKSESELPSCAICMDNPGFILF